MELLQSEILVSPLMFSKAPFSGEPSKAFPISDAVLEYTKVSSLFRRLYRPKMNNKVNQLNMLLHVSHVKRNNIDCLKSISSIDSYLLSSGRLL